MLKATSKRRLLTRRQVLRSPAVLLISYVLFVLALCLLGSKTVWCGYAWWHVPTLLAGIASSALALVGALGVPLLLKHAFWPGKRRAKQVLLAWFRHGRPTVVLTYTALAVAIAGAFIPRSDPLAEVFAQLENPPHRLRKAKSELDGLRKRTSLAKSDGFRVAEFVLAYKTGQGKWREEDSDDCRKPAMSFIDSSSPRICGWARLLYGGAISLFVA